MQRNLHFRMENRIFGPLAPLRRWSCVAPEGVDLRLQQRVAGGPRKCPASESKIGDPGAAAGGDRFFQATYLPILPYWIF